MSLPTVTALMLVNGRHAMVAQAVQSFLRQSHPAELRKLLIWDTGEPKYAPPFVYDHTGVEIWHHAPNSSIGFMRNDAISQATSDIICHWDSDDISGPDRIAEQVALLQSSGADCVGYNQVLFWAEPRAGKRPGECWLYTDRRPTYAIGASLAYWREIWKRRPFQDAPKRPQATGEDSLFVDSVKCVGVSSIEDPAAPRLLCRIHSQDGGNSQDYSNIWNPRVRQSAFVRAPNFDELCRSYFECTFKSNR